MSAESALAVKYSILTCMSLSKTVLIIANWRSSKMHKVDCGYLI